jgi:hypothetical protein
VGEEFAAHEVVGLESGGYVFPVDADRHPHQHVLRSFDDPAVDLQ